MTKEEYKKLLEDHDWYYAMSDSSTVWQRGVNQAIRLKDAYKANDTFKQMYEEKRNSIFKLQNKNS